MPFLDGKYDRGTLATMHRALEGAWREVELAVGGSAADFADLHKIMELKIEAAAKAGERDGGCLKRLAFSVVDGMC